MGSNNLWWDIAVERLTTKYCSKGQRAFPLDFNRTLSQPTLIQPAKHEVFFIGVRVCVCGSIPRVTVANSYERAITFSRPTSLASCTLHLPLPTTSSSTCTIRHCHFVFHFARGNTRGLACAYSSLVSPYKPTAPSLHHEATFQHPYTYLTCTIHTHPQASIF